jgi:cyanophycin synthetase
MDSRRLTGPNLLWDGAGAVIDVELDDGSADELIARWRRSARLMLDAVGWPGEKLYSRRFPGGASVALSAPLDTLYSATEVNEWAWAVAVAEVSGGTAPDLEAGAKELREKIRAEENPRMIRIALAAREQDLDFLSDDRFVSVGVGDGAMVWPRRELPDPSRIDWTRVHNRPIALVTGGNGKTTTTRLIGAMAQAGGMVPGITSTDGIQIGGSVVEAGDFAGPSGARTALRDNRVELAVLETARGGILRRGLAVHRADAAIITNIADDHLGEFGVHDLATLTATKLVVARALGSQRPLVLNADDAELVKAAGTVQCPIIWFSLDSANPVVRDHLARGGTAVLLVSGALVLRQGGRATPIERVENIPITLGGAARHNVANALGAIGVAGALGIDPGAIGKALGEFEGTTQDNPGRLNRWELGGVTIIVDFAHNPHGLTALLEMAKALPARRRLVLLGQAGDRDDQAIRELARIAWRIRPDRVIAKEMEEYRRGRPIGEIPGLIEDELLRLGADPGSIQQAPSELEAIHLALQWAEPGDLLVLTVHGQRGEVLELLERLQEQDWAPGQVSTVQDGHSAR